MSDENRDQSAETDQRSGGGVVRTRGVVSRPISRQEQATIRGDGPDVATLHPDAPKPKARNEYRPVLKQMKRVHRAQQNKQPSYMSDIKI